MQSSTSLNGLSLSRASFLDRLCRNILANKLSGLERGRIELIDPAAGTMIFGSSDADPEHRVVVRINRLRAYSRIALGGSIGSGESYFQGDWDCDDLSRLIRIFVLNRDLLNTLDGGIGALIAPAHKLFHTLRKNSIRGAQRNIQAHYDLGNDFFALFLDPTWMYSCGIFTRPDAELFDASTEKNDRICRKLKLSPQHRVIEIGTGWGGFAIHAAKNYGCHVTTTTISKQQHELASARIREEGLEGRIKLLFQDYRRLTGVYDKLVSIEMIEAVGLDHLGTYFEKCSSLLKTDGEMLLQAITIRDQYYDHARRNVDFIQRYIFPGSGIPSIQSIANAVAKKTDLRISALEDIGSHYATTLRRWSENLRGNKDKVLDAGYSEELYRLWQFYLGYCEGGFHERSTSCVQVKLSKPENRGE
jgi:cyclopropane-fatty-acyl-phospholipid synthase